MSNDLNQCQFIGRLGADPETRHTASGNAVCNLRIAVGYKYKDQEHTEWVRLVAFGKLAEICDNYLTKGKQIYASGRMQTRKWTGQDGQDRYSTEVVLNDMQMLGGRNQADQPAQSAPVQPSATPPADNFDQDDIPF